MKTYLLTATVFLCIIGCTPVNKQPTTEKVSAAAQQPIRIEIGGVELHYIEQGKGETVILLHGGQNDYRSWPQLMNALAPHYHVISYSRRYHFPNENKITSTAHSALIDASDLAGLIAKLKTGPVHLVGTSYGAFTALAFAMDHPDRVRSLVLAEPAVLQWALNSDRGTKLYRAFIDSVHGPAGSAFAQGNDEAAMRLLIDRFDGVGVFDALPPERKRSIMANANFFKAVTASSDPFPDLPREKIKQLTMPVLLIRGAHTKELHQLVNEEVAHVLTQAEQSIIPNAGHGSPRQNPSAFNAAVVSFLERVRSKNK